MDDVFQTKLVIVVIIITDLLLGISDLLLGITDLNTLLIACKKISKDKWKTIGLHLGLHEPTLDVIGANHKGDVETCFMKCLSVWLKRTDDSIPTKFHLAEALKEVGEGEVAAEIICKFKVLHCGYS